MLCLFSKINKTKKLLKRYLLARTYSKTLTYQQILHSSYNGGSIYSHTMTEIYFRTNSDISVVNIVSRKLKLSFTIHIIMATWFRDGYFTENV